VSKIRQELGGRTQPRVKNKALTKAKNLETADRIFRKREGGGANQIKGELFKAPRARLSRARLIEENKESDLPSQEGGGAVSRDEDCLVKL